MNNRILNKSGSTEELGLIFIKRILPSSEYHNCGNVPSIAMYKKYYRDKFTGELIERTDLDEKKGRRIKSLGKFFDYYIPMFFDLNKITIFSMVVSQRAYPDISAFLRNYNRKIKRFGVKTLGFIWVRDVGPTHGGKHFHLLYATSKIKEEDLPKFISPKSDLRKKRNYKYKSELLETRFGMNNYLRIKDIYAESKQKSYGFSKFKYL